MNHSMFVQKYLESLPEGQFVLADAGYAMVHKRVLVPYRKVRYHLKEFAGSSHLSLPQNAKELFNLRHSSLRNVIERSFGVFKRRWAILNHCECNPEFLFRSILAAAYLHNYLIDCKDGFYTQQPIDSSLATDEDNSSDDCEPAERMYEESQNNENNGKETHTLRNARKLSNEWRDQIAEQMWKEYIQMHPKQKAAEIEESIIYLN